MLAQRGVGKRAGHMPFIQRHHRHIGAVGGALRLVANILVMPGQQREEIVMRNGGIPVSETHRLGNLPFSSCVWQNQQFSVDGLKKGAWFKIAPVYLYN